MSERTNRLPGKSMAVWVKFGRTSLHPATLYRRLPHDKAGEWRTWKRARITLDQSKQKKAKKP